MKKQLYTFFLALCLSFSTAQAQDLLLQSFDDPAAIGNWINSTAGSHSLSAAPEHLEGTGAVSLSYNLVCDQSWGGSVDVQMAPPGGGTFGDMSAADGISFWFKAKTPASGTVAWTTKVLVNSTGGTEEWHATLGTVVSDPSGEWLQAKLPFSGFAIPSWLPSLDGVFYLDQIKEIQMQIVGGPGITAAGEVYLDGLSSYTEGGTAIGTLLESFDATGDIGNWINSTAGSYSLNSSSDATEGSAAACLDYILIADQGWGGSVDLQFTPDAGNTTFPDLTGEEGIRFDFKVTQPASVTNGVTWNVKVYINSNGGEEQWHAALGNVVGDASGAWQEGKLPFSSFAIPNWTTTYDGVLYLDQITKIEMQVIAGPNIETNGTICLDNLTSYSAGSTTLYDGYTLNGMDSPTLGVGSWMNSTAGSYTEYPAPGAVGDSAACVSYNLVGDQGWGGSVDMQFLPNNAPTFPDMEGHLGISFWYKVGTPATPAANVSFTVKLLVNSTGGQEQYTKSVGGILANNSGEWVRVNTAFTEYTIPSWLPTYDGVLYLDSIAEIQFQLLGGEGTTTVGDICFDNLISYDDEEVFLGTVNPVGSEVRIFPNPASTELRIEGLDNVRSVQVFNLGGSLVKSFNGVGNSLDVSDLNGGLYFLKIYTEGAVYSAKVMKQ